MKVIDADKRIIGRLASEIAREAKRGEDVRVLNSESAVVSGDREDVFEDYKQKVDRGSRDNGPYYPKSPDGILKRTVKGMLPDGDAGREALSRVRTYLGVPDEFEEDLEQPDVKQGSDLKNRNYVKIGDVSEHVGWEASGGLYE